jgi:RimJ/RimL family protein N-acetyltransferase
MTWNDDPQPTLPGERLVVRPFTFEDAPRVEALAGAREIADTTAHVPYPYPAGGAATWIATHSDRWAAGEGAPFAIATPDDGLVGAIGLIISLRRNAAELGYWIGFPYWGRGFATEAARTLLDFGFGTIGLNRIQATYFTRNPASGRVMEKLGMQTEGIFRQAERKWGVYEDVAQKAILRSEWAAGRAP